MLLIPVGVAIKNIYKITNQLANISFSKSSKKILTFKQVPLLHPFPSLMLWKLLNCCQIYWSFQVHAAYKRALFKFHPDRASKTDIREQVEAEEKFKVITRMKEKFSFPK